mmetsp:Transcript_23226/g.20102  ORF Transcript_23226/g.20102 Transcript_23226/m.20102 type:complete len:116 (+) Transcript_23226:1441-1788(+)
MNIAPGKEMSAVLIIDNPRIAGEFTTSWRLACKDESGNVQFLGKPFNLSFKVADVDEPKPKVESPKKKEYPKEVVTKVDQLNGLFPDANRNALLEFVNVNKNLSIEELVDNYLNL